MKWKSTTSPTNWTSLNSDLKTLRMLKTWICGQRLPTLWIWLSRLMILPCASVKMSSLVAFSAAQWIFMPNMELTVFSTLLCPSRVLQALLSAQLVQVPPQLLRCNLLTTFSLLLTRLLTRLLNLDTGPATNSTVANWPFVHLMELSVTVLIITVSHLRLTSPTPLALLLLFLVPQFKRRVCCSLASGQMTLAFSSSPRSFIVLLRRTSPLKTTWFPLVRPKFSKKAPMLPSLLTVCNSGTYVWPLSVQRQ